MEVVVYTRPGCDQSRRIKDLLSEKGVAFEEHVCNNGKVDNADLRSLGIDVTEVPMTVVDGVAIAGMNRPRIEQAIGWIGS